MLFFLLIRWSRRSIKSSAEMLLAPRWRACLASGLSEVATVCCRGFFTLWSSSMINSSAVCPSDEKIISRSLICSLDHIPVWYLESNTRVIDILMFDVAELNSLMSWSRCCCREVFLTEMRKRMLYPSTK